MSDDEKLYYLQENSMIVGNDILWWKEGRSGYTTDIEKAHVFTEKEAFRQAKMRDSDIPWPKEYIDKNTRRVVDVQDIDLGQAVASEPEEAEDTGIVMETVSSSNIKAIGYDVGDKILAIEFNSGTLYHYSHIPFSVCEELMTAPSVGKYFHAHIRSSFPYEKQ